MRADEVVLRLAALVVVAAAELCLRTRPAEVVVDDEEGCCKAGASLLVDERSRLGIVNDMINKCVFVYERIE